MNRRFLYCVLQGPAFSPGLAAEHTGLGLVDANEPGDVPPSGRYAGKALAEGSALLVLLDDDLNAEAEDPDAALAALSAFQATLPQLRALGATRLSLSLVVAYAGDCHFALSPGELSAVAALGLPLEVSCHPAAT